MSSPRPGLLLLAGCAALVALGSASARPNASLKYGGQLVVGLGGDADTLDPTLSRLPAATAPIFQAICETLYQTNSRLQPVPVLAASLPAPSTDKLTYTIRLRQGVLFNDGTPFNAQAVVATVQRDLTLPGSSQATLYGNLDSVTASGLYTVVYHLKVRDSAFEGNPYVLSPTALAKYGDNFAASPVCVGPFMFDHRVVGDNVTVIKSPYYYDRANVFLDKIVFKPMPDQAAAVAALRAGDIQVLNQISTTELPAVRQTSSLRVIQAYQLGWSGITFNLGNRNGPGNPPYSNTGTALASSAKLRQAFEEAIDRTTLNKVIYDGLYQATCTEIVPADLPWYDATKIPCTPYDPADAKKLVAASGISNPTVRLMISNTADNLRRGQFIQAQEAAVGINVVLDITDSVTNTARRASGNFDAYLGGFTPGGVDPTVVIRVGTTDVANYAGYSNPRMDYVLANGLKATDPKARAVNYRVAQQIIQADRPYIPLINPRIFAGVSANVTGVRLIGNGVIAVQNARYR